MASLRLHQLPSEIERVGRLVDPELGEDLLVSVPRTKISWLKTVMVVRSVKIRKLGSRHRRVEPAQLGLVVLQDRRVLDRDQPVVHALGDGPAAHGVMHEAPGDVDLPDRAAGPRDHLRGEHRA